MRVTLALADIVVLMAFFPELLKVKLSTPKQNKNVYTTYMMYISLMPVKKK